MPADWEAFSSGLQSAYGSSATFEAHLRDHRPDLIVPERSITCLEHGIGWSKKDEEPPQPGEACHRCGDSIKPGSHLYCPACGSSGFERSLREQRRLAGIPRPDPRPEDHTDGQKGGRS